jgi:hypothetical protein
MYEVIEEKKWERSIMENEYLKAVGQDNLEETTDEER